MKKLMNNEYFQRMKNYAIEQGAKKELIEDQKKIVAEEKGWDCPEMDLLTKMADMVKNEDKYSSGEWSAYRAWQNTIYKNHDAEVLEMSDFLWEESIAGFVQALRDAEIKKFYFTNTSTAVMENIHGFIAAGCKMAGTVSWDIENAFYTEHVMGIEFEL